MTSKNSSKRPASETERDRSRQRRRRTFFTDEQLDRLEDSFANEKYPRITQREDLARELNIGEDRIQVWFQNRRSYWRKHETEEETRYTRPKFPSTTQCRFPIFSRGTQPRLHRG